MPKKPPFVLYAVLLATTTLVGLKLAGIGPVAHWRWWAVTSPLWGTYGLVLAAALVLVGFQSAWRK